MQPSLKIKPALPLGVAWLWVKSSFSTFREKPINFLYFALAYLVCSLLPIVGAFLAVLVLIRIYLSADCVDRNLNFGLAINFSYLFRQSNIAAYALISVSFDLVTMLVAQVTLAQWGVAGETNALISDPRVLYLFAGLSLIRTLFFGISAVIITFNPQLTISTALKLSLHFIAKYFAVIGLGLFLLLPFLLIPIYLLTIFSLGSSSILLTLVSLSFILILSLVLLAVTSIFSYKLYQDGFEQQ